MLIGCSANRASTHAPEQAPRRARPTIAGPAVLYLDHEETPSGSVNLTDLRFVGMDDGPVPDFRLRAIDGQWLDSRQLVGERAFVVFFFATWCLACDLKLPLLQRAVHAAGPVDLIGVAVDDVQTWPRVRPFLERHGLNGTPIVPARRFPAFTISYNPFSTVPLVVVVGQNGGLVDYQVGYAPDDEQRLEAAVRLATHIGPLKAVH